MAPLPRPFQDCPPYFTWWHHLQPSHASTPALDLPGSQPPSQRHRSGLSQPIWPHGRATLGAGRSPESPSLLPQFPSAYPCWPSCLSVLTALGACFTLVTNTGSGVQQPGFGSCITPEGCTWRSHPASPSLCALIHNKST